MQPKVSILSPSFNHEQYVGAFIQSVLAQSMSDFELIIVDDCSRDNNVAEIQKYTDSRIKLVCHEYNQGINASVNTAFEHASGEYLVFCASDDMLEPNAIEVLYQTLRDNPEVKAVYPRLTIVDKDGNRSKKELLAIQPQSRVEYIHHFFMKGTCLTSPGMAMRSDTFKAILYPMDHAMCNQQDTQMHIKILLHGDIKVLDEYLVLYRFDERTSNISKPNAATFKRENLEVQNLMNEFLAIKDIALLQQVFQKEITQLNIQPHNTTIPYFLGRMALTSLVAEKSAWGYHKVMESYRTKEQAALLHNLYGFDFKEYLGLSTYIRDQMTSRYKKYKKLFKMTCIANVVLCVCIAWLLIM